MSQRIATATFFFLNGLILASWVVRIPAIQHKLNLSPATFGFVLLGLACGALVGMPIAGGICRRYGSKSATTIGAVLLVLSLPLAAVAGNAAELFCALFALGFANGATDVSMNAQAISVERVYARSIMPSFHAFWSVGGIVGSAIGAGLIALRVSPLTHFCGVGLAIIVIAAIASFYLVPQTDDGHEQTAEAKAAYTLTLKDPVIILGLIAFGSMLVEGAIADWSAIYLHRSLRASQEMAALGYGSFACAMTIGRFLGDGWTHHYGPVAMVRTGSILAAAGFAAALAFGTIPITIVGLICVGLGVSVAVPLIFSAAGNLPNRSPGPAIAAVSTIGYLGFLAGPPIIGFIASVTTLRAALVIVVVISILVASNAKMVSPASKSSSGTLT